MLKPLFAALLAATAGAAAADKITFYQDDNYGGRQFTADGAVSNFERNGFNDRVRSAVVHDGRWEICVDAEFGGGCGILGPGAYPNLGAYAGRISSTRPVDGRYSGNQGTPGNSGYAGSPGYRQDDRGGDRTSARATLYEGTNLSGRSFRVNNTMRNLDVAGFNDRASSLRVESGYWIFCSDSEFRGECRTFGPGDYASLPGLNNSISSGRQIAANYPYDSKPDWQRDYPYRQSQTYQR
jgi:hypothetical protein